MSAYIPIENTLVEQTKELAECCVDGIENIGALAQDIGLIVMPVSLSKFK